MSPLSLLRAEIGQAAPLVERTVAAGGRQWRVTSVENQDILIDRMQTEEDLERFPYGLLLWASAVSLAEWIAENPNAICGRTVLELGAGAGLPGIVAQANGGGVTQTDYQQPALDLARLNALSNKVTGIQYGLLDWRTRSDIGTFDLVIGADVLYERTLHAALLETLRQTVAPGGFALLTDPMRPQAAAFIAMAIESEWKVETASRQVWWEGERKEIAFYTLRPPLSTTAGADS